MQAITPDILSGIASQLQRYFDNSTLQASSLPELERQIASLVNHLLQIDLHRLLHILYRIDVEEQQVRMALARSSTKEVALAIARLIIKRELQKVQTRFRYQQN